MATPTRQAWRTFEEIAAGLTIPDPWDTKAFLTILGQERGRPIELRPVITRPGTPCGLLLSTDRADYVFYASNTTPFHQLHIQCHETAHLLCGHIGTIALDSQVAALLMPSLPTSVIERVLGRTVYSAEQEHDAELLGSLIMKRIARTSSRGRPHDPDNLGRLSGIFDVIP